MVKAPDWAYVATIQVPREQVKRSYKPRPQGEIPAIVKEILKLSGFTFRFLKNSRGSSNKYFIYIFSSIQTELYTN